MFMQLSVLPVPTNGTPPKCLSILQDCQFSAHVNSDCDCISSLRTLPHTASRCLPSPAVPHSCPLLAQVLLFKAQLSLTLILPHPLPPAPVSCCIR